MKASTTLRTVAIAAAALAGAAALNVASARRVERRHPACGRFIDIDDARVHYTDEGTGPAVVLLHGNGLNARDWKHSGLTGALTSTHRVIAFDRPGFGHSTRPRSRAWSAAEQATLIHKALQKLGVGRAVIVGHSWGTLVALALALEYPDDCARLLLISGYYFGSFRPETFVFGAPALPVAGDVMRYTISPPLASLLAPALAAQVFSPAHVDDGFTGELPLSTRPSQILANAQDSALMIPSAAAMQHRYKDITVPAVIIAGAGDKVVRPSQSRRLAREMPEAQLLVVEGAGHMVHYSANEMIAESIAVMAGAAQRQTADRAAERDEEMDNTLV